MGPAAHLAEVDRTVFSADVLFALVVGWLGLRGDGLACQAEQETIIMSAFAIITPLSHKATVSSELQEGPVTFSGKCDTTVEPFVVGAVPLRKRLRPCDKRFQISHLLGFIMVVRPRLTGAEQVWFLTPVSVKVRVTTVQHRLRLA